jgi:opacity protein-like surface antigen
MILKEQAILLLSSIFIIWMGFSQSAHAETYAGISLGASLSHDITDIRGTASTREIATGSDVKPDDAFAFGFKVGHYFRYIPWFGVEFNFYQRGPDVERQAATANRTAGVLIDGVGGTGQLKIDVNSVSTLGFLAMIRTTKEQTINLYNFQPFLGVGLGVNVVDLGDITSFTQAGAFNSGSNLDSDTSFGVLMSVGLNYKLTHKVKVYGEYKYIDNSYSFRATDGVKYELDMADSSLMFGASYSF